jgi:tRNA/tmRNA/rRNA uracil-C5-methylase (TrmA/RlmC/RlmD family)
MRDLEILQERGYKVEKACAVDMFPQTVHVETVVLITRKND